ncbi:hypothetical protein CSOJ01_13902 [Colletotrichum sojae]|uniref:Uncharacterized protein n=1 Tax=Colletotrichum sojae TaxID=2175907 RepID=A0A8H6IRX5_9PEZI|nr:hypothetical protein CSOJ01_13902 [Colletotrichum sojae]
MTYSFLRRVDPNSAKETERTLIPDFKDEAILGYDEWKEALLKPAPAPAGNAVKSGALKRVNLRDRRTRVRGVPFPDNTNFETANTQLVSHALSTRQSGLPCLGGVEGVGDVMYVTLITDVALFYKAHDSVRPPRSGGRL